jgi:chromosomal replication initiation ATPase DnaA
MTDPRQSDTVARRRRWIEPRPAICMAVTTLDDLSTPPPLMRDILGVVASVCGVTIKELKSESRFTKLVRARKIFYFTAKELTGNSWQRIASAVGRFDHSVAYRGVAKINANRENYEPQLTTVLEAFTHVKIPDGGRP